MVGVGAALWQSTNWRTLFGGFAPLAWGLNCVPTPMQKKAIFRVFHKELSSGEWNSMSRGMPWKCFQVMSLLTGHGMSPPMWGMRNCRDDEKFLCKRCPLKHEARKRERGEMLYENVSKWKIYHKKTCVKKYNCCLKYMIYMWYGHNHP